ncbi:hypothetical protein BGZ82_001265 [Podila clonocystis]|nr:hypothetical protein BGZ82_001265 [Podila clonocystis]
MSHAQIKKVELPKSLRDILPLSVIARTAVFNKTWLINTRSYPARETTVKNAKLQIPKRKSKTFFKWVAKNAAYFV